MEEALKRFAERLRPRVTSLVTSLVVKALENKAKRDPRVLARMGGSAENARKRLEAEMSRPSFGGPPPLEVKKTLVRESGLARIIARHPTAFSAHAQSEPSDAAKVISENEIEAYLHTIRRGEAQFSERLTETYQHEREKFHANVEGKLDKFREAAKRKQVTPKEAQELEEGLDEFKKLVTKLDGVAGILGAWSFRRRVRHARGKFHQAPKDHE